ncbi:hypothetical protein AtNW77_MTg0323151 (mitochondrion) [Arabidopsis thaliana]
MGSRSRSPVGKILSNYLGELLFFSLIVLCLTQSKWDHRGEKYLAVSLSISSSLAHSQQFPPFLRFPQDSSLVVIAIYNRSVPCLVPTLHSIIELCGKYRLRRSRDSSVCGWCIIRKDCFARRAWLNQPKSRKPKPPSSSLDLHNFCQATHEIFLLFSQELHQNSVIALVNFLHSSFESRKHDIAYTERNRLEERVRVDRVWTAVELAKHALEADPTRVSKLGRCYETEPATVLRAGTGVTPNNGSTTVGVISQLITIRTKKRNSSEMTGTTAFTATAIGFSYTMAFPVVLGVTQTRTPVTARL